MPNLRFELRAALSAAASGAAVLAALWAAPAAALPVFAHRFDLSCGACHIAVPRLTPFGQAFARAGYRLPDGMPARRTFPVALKINLAYSSAADPSGLPRTIVDEVELLAGAPLGGHASYRIEQYAVDGGVVGKTRDAWLSYTSRPTFGDPLPALRVTAGEFTLPLPVDPETQRDTENHYAIFDQTVGGDPFNFFDDKIGVDVAYGAPFGAGTDLHVLALQGHDVQSGLASSGLDRMLYAQAGSPTASLAAYRYDGSRPIQPVADRFWRQGVALHGSAGDADLDVLAQTGDDSSARGVGASARSSGGFAQLRWTWSPRLFGIVRYDTTDDAIAGMRRSLTTSLVIRPYRNARLTLEDVVEGGKHTLDAGWLFAY